MIDQVTGHKAVLALRLAHEPGLPSFKRSQDEADGQKGSEKLKTQVFGPWRHVAKPWILTRDRLQPGCLMDF